MELDAGALQIGGDVRADDCHGRSLWVYVGKGGDQLLDAR
jgi:hypothetical protein